MNAKFVVNLCNININVFAGSKHQKLQISAVADVIELLESASFAVDRNSPTKQPDGAVVIDALPHASCICLPPRLQRMVL